MNKLIITVIFLAGILLSSCKKTETIYITQPAPIPTPIDTTHHGKVFHWFVQVLDSTDISVPSYWCWTYKPTINIKGVYDNTTGINQTIIGDSVGFGWVVFTIPEPTSHVFYLMLTVSDGVKTDSSVIHGFDDQMTDSSGVQLCLYCQ